jgi:hypothetical protein
MPNLVEQAPAKRGPPDTSSLAVLARWGQRRPFGIPQPTLVEAGGPRPPLYLAGFPPKTSRT